MYVTTGILMDISTISPSREALDMPKLRLVPLTPSIAYRSTVLPPPFHDDPADQIIVATARDENATIVTADERIQSYSHCRHFW